MFDIKLLKIEELTGIIQEFKEPSLQLTDQKILPTRAREGHSVAWDIENIPRDIGSFEGRHSPAGMRDPITIGQQNANLVRTFKSKTLPGSLLIDLRKPGTDQRQAHATDEVTRNLKALHKLIARQDEFLTARALQDNLVITQGLINITIDYGYTDGVNKNLVIGGGGNNVAVAWTNPTADIIGDVERLTASMIEESGFEPMIAKVSGTVLAAILKNNEIQAIMGGTVMAVEALQKGFIKELMGLSWQKYDTSFKDSAGVVQRYLDKRDVLICPAPDEEWGWTAVGSDSVPTDDKKGIREITGEYAYTTLVENPAAIAMFAGKKRLPIIGNDKAVSITRVTA